MIPQFPEFKRLEVSDKKAIEKYIAQFPPYSDFNFISMWSWDIKRKMGVSLLDGNIVVRFSDYVDGKAFYSIIGSFVTDETIGKLFSALNTKKQKVTLRLLPEVAVQKITALKYDVILDDDNNDYIYDIAKLCTYAGNTYMTKRNLVHRFERQHKDPKTIVMDLARTEVQKMIDGVEKLWCVHKDQKSPDMNSLNEMKAIKRLFAISADPNIVTVGIFDGEKMLGFCINELLHGEYTISHFAKTTPHSPGAYAYLMRENAIILKQKGKTLLNFEQDLGIPSLRHAKRSFRPQHYLKKYFCAAKDVV